jgi:hypothetical protein
MNLLYRALYFRTFVVFFLIILPFLVLFTLGYDLNLNKSGLSKSLLISIETIPRGAKIQSENKFVASTPTEIRTANNKPITLDITQANYFPEKFTFLSNSNNVANISNLALLPQKPTALSKTDSQETLIAILKEDLVLTQINGKYGTKSYNFGSIQNTFNQLENSDLISIVNNSFEDLGNAYWFPDSNALIILKEGGGLIKNLQKLPSSPIKIVKKNDDFLIQDASNKLWKYNSITDRLFFVDSGVTGLSKTISPDFIWILKGSKVSRLDDITDTNLQVDTNNPYFTFDTIDNTENKISFEAHNVFQGILFKYDSKLYYVPDYDSRQFQIVSVLARNTYTSGSVIFWINDKNDLFASNLELKTENLLGNLSLTSANVDRIKMTYYPTWKRLFVYQSSGSSTVWYNKDTANNSVLKYYPYSFSTGSCLVGIFEKNQFCIENNQLVSYRNTRIW